MNKETSDGSTAGYYQFPEGASELQDLISYKNMNGQIAEIFRACYRYGEVSHSSMLRDAKKIRFYAEAEIARLEKYDNGKKEGVEISYCGEKPIDISKCLIENKAFIIRTVREANNKEMMR